MLLTGSVAVSGRKPPHLHQKPLLGDWKLQNQSVVTPSWITASFPQPACRWMQQLELATHAKCTTELWTVCIGADNLFSSYSVLSEASGIMKVALGICALMLQPQQSWWPRAKSSIRTRPEWWRSDVSRCRHSGKHGYKIGNDALLAKGDLSV